MGQQPIEEQSAIGLTWPLIATSATVLLVATLSWPKRWLLSGCAVETLLILFAARLGTRIFPSVPLWTLLTSLNLIYAVVSTSWLLYGFFTLACWPFVALTCLFQFEIASDFARKQLRHILRDLHFTRDRIALFNLPALEIDTEVAGLLVVRGVTISLSDLTLVAHGIEVGIKLTDDIELALHADEVRIPFFRRIEVNDVYGNVKGGKAEMTFAEVEDEEETDVDNFFNETPLLRAATAGFEGVKDRPLLRESLAGGSYIKDSSAGAAFKSIKTLSPDDQKAEQQYMDMLTEIRTSNAVYQSRARVRKEAKAKGTSIDDEKELRAAVCATLHEYPSVPHAPTQSVKVTTLKKLSSPRVQTFMHRLPFLLRLLLGPLGYFHPVTFNSITAAGSGQWVTELLQQHLFKHHGDNSAEVRRLQKRLQTWLQDANFCVQLTDIDGLGQVPLSSSFDIVAYLHMADIMAYRTLPQSGVLTQVVRLGGADATFTVPSFLLPHHEHLLPPRPTAEDEEEMDEQVEEADGIPKIVQAEKARKRVKKDEAEITMSVHASLPAAFDQSLLTFIAALVKATKIIEFDKEVEKMDPQADNVSDNGDATSQTSTPGPATPTTTGSSLSRASTRDSMDSTEFNPSPIHKRVQSDLTGVTSPSSRLKAFTRNLQQNLRDVSVNTQANLQANLNKESIRDFTRSLQQNTRDGVKRTLVGSMMNDRWIAKMVGKIAANLERAQGDVGYSGAIPIPLEPYRPGPGDDGMLSKLLP